MQTMALGRLIYLCSLVAGFAIVAATVFAATLLANLK